MPLISTAAAMKNIEYIPTCIPGGCMYGGCMCSGKTSSGYPATELGQPYPETAVELIKSGNADFVMFGRPLIADPYLPKKVA